MRESYGYTGLQVKNLPTLVIPSQIEGKEVVSFGYITNIGDKASYRTILRGIKEIIYPNTLKIITGKYQMILSDVEKVTLPEGIRELEDCAFVGMSQMKSITIPASVENLGSAFRGCSKDLEVNILGKDSIEDFTLTASDPFHTGTYIKGLITNINYLGK